mgnify:CR=1 FL=1
MKKASEPTNSKVDKEEKSEELTTMEQEIMKAYFEFMEAVIDLKLYLAKRMKKSFDPTELENWSDFKNLQRLSELR